MSPVPTVSKTPSYVSPNPAHVNSKPASDSFPAVARTLRNVRNAAGRTFMRLSSSASKESPQPPPPSSQRLKTPDSAYSQDVDLGVFRIVRLLVSDSGLLRVVSTPTGSLLDDASRTRLAAFEQGKTPKHQVTEVIFHTRSIGVTLENSKVHPYQIYVKDFSSGDSPALESGGVSVGDVFLGVSNALAHVRSFGELSTLTDFVQASARPICLRFCRDLTPSIDIDTVSSNASMTKYWLGFLAGGTCLFPRDNSRKGVTDADAETAHRSSVETITSSDEYEDNPVLAWARFSLDVRRILQGGATGQEEEDMLASVVEKHVIKQAFLTSTWTEADASLSSWWQSRQSGIPSSISVDQVKGWLDTSRKQTEVALSHAYFKRFLHSEDALALYQEHGLAFGNATMEIAHLRVGFTEIMNRRTLGDLFLISLLCTREAKKLVLWLDIEHKLKPSLQDMARNPSDDTAQAIWRQLKRMESRFLDRQAGLLNVSLKNKGAVLAEIQELLSNIVPDFGLPRCASCGDEIILIGIKSRLIPRMEAISSLLAMIQTELGEELERGAFSAFAQDKQSLFSNCLYAMFVERSADLKEESLRLTSLLQKSPLPRGMQIHRAMNTLVDDPSAKNRVRVARFLGISEDNRKKVVIDDEFLSKSCALFCIPQGADCEVRVCVGKEGSCVHRLEPRQ